MDKTVEYYLGLPYTIELTPEPEGGYFVAVKELPGCMSQGDTPDEAIEMIQDAMRGWIEISLEDGDPIPEPRELDDYSGKFVVRVPRSLHRQLVEAAAEEGVSLNQYINVALAQAVVGPRAAAPSARREVYQATTGLGVVPSVLAGTQRAGAAQVLHEEGAPYLSEEQEETTEAGDLKQQKGAA